MIKKEVTHKDKNEAGQNNDTVSTMKQEILIQMNSIGLAKKVQFFSPQSDQ